MSDHHRHYQTTADFRPRQFRIEVHEREVEDLKRRLRETRWPVHFSDRDGDADGDVELGWDYGAPPSWVKSMARQWEQSYDWKEEEGKLNKLNHFKVEIESIDLHFLHHRSENDNAIPLILCHGWPGSFLEFVDCIPILTDPKSHGIDGPSFHVVIPSLPGFTFSSPPPPPSSTLASSGAGAKGGKEQGGKGTWRVDDTARIFDKLMVGLGYGTYAAQGGDWGSVIARCLGSQYSERCKAVHLNFLPAPAPFPMNLFASSPSIVRSVTGWLPESLMSSKEKERIGRALDYVENGSGYYAIQPLSLGYGIDDSPVGLIGWIGEKFAQWNFKTDGGDDSKVGTGSGISTNKLLTSLSLYYFTRSSTTSFMIYKDNPHFTTFLGDYKYYIRVPLAMSVFPGEIATVPKAWCARTGNLVWYKESPKGGHFAAAEEPRIFSEHLCKAFDSIWQYSLSASFRL